MPALMLDARVIPRASLRRDAASQLGHAAVDYLFGAGDQQRLAGQLERGDRRYFVGPTETPQRHLRPHQCTELLLCLGRHARGLEEIGGDRAGADRGAPDAARAKFAGKTTYQLARSALGRAIDRSSGQTHAPRKRSIQQHRGAVLERRRQRLCLKERRTHVDRVLSVELLSAHRVRRLEAAAAGVEEDAIELVDAVDLQRRGEGRCGGRVGRVVSDVDRSLTKGFAPFDAFVLSVNLHRDFCYDKESIAMALLTVRNVPDSVRDHLNLRAATGTSMEAHVRRILPQACPELATAATAASLAAWLAFLYGLSKSRGAEALLEQRTSAELAEHGAAKVR